MTRSSSTHSGSTRLRPADLSQNRPTPFDLRPDATQLRQLADDLGLSGLRKLRFTGEIAAHGQEDWQLSAHLGATVVQPCVVSLAPVTTRLDLPVHRRYLAQLPEIDLPEAEMPEDDNTESLPSVIDLDAVMAEALALALPLYPRAEGAGLEEAVFAAPGIAPMRDEDARPFAGLAGLREQLNKKD